jgi:Tfp pilus assembly protein PilO
MSPSARSSSLQAPLPTWMRRAGAGLTALVAVLFVVLLLQVRQQGERIQTLQDKLQTLENEKDLDRTNALEEQVRSTAERLQNLEGLEQTVQSLRSEQDSLRAQLRSQDRAPQFPLDNGVDLNNKPKPGRLPALPPLPSGQE